MHKSKKIFFFNKYKMFKISAEIYAKTCVYYMIDKEKKLRLKDKDIGEK